MRAGTEVRDLRPWLYRIAHNQALNALRAAGSALPAATEELPAVSLETEVVRREELRETLDGIQALPDRQRAALVAVAVADRPHADVAAELGMSDGALRQLLLRARTTLRAAATALTPYPLMTWLAGGQEVTAARVSEVAAGAGGVGAGGSRPAPPCWPPERWWPAAPRCAASMHRAPPRPAPTPSRPIARLRPGARWPSPRPRPAPTIRRATRHGRRSTPTTGATGAAAGHRPRHGRSGSGHDGAGDSSSSGSGSSGKGSGGATGTDSDDVESGGGDSGSGGSGSSDSHGSSGKGSSGRDGSSGKDSSGREGSSGEGSDDTTHEAGETDVVTSGEQPVATQPETISSGSGDGGTSGDGSGSSGGSGSGDDGSGSGSEGSGGG